MRVVRRNVSLFVGAMLAWPLLMWLATAILGVSEPSMLISMFFGIVWGFVAFLLFPPVEPT